MQPMRTRRLACLVALGIGLASSAFGQADQFPTKPIRLIVPYAAGGGTDLVMRAIAPGMSEALGQPIVVENRPGAGTIAATEASVRAEPDGHHLLAVGAPIYLNTALGIKTPYDPLRDLAPVSLLVNNPGLLLVGSSVHAKSVKELVALSKSRGRHRELADAGMLQYAGLAIWRHSVDVAPLVSLATRYQLTVYDAAYLLVASELRAPLITFDTRLAEAARLHLGSLQ